YLVEAIPSVLAGHREVRVIGHGHERAHPRVDVTLEREHLTAGPEIRVLDGAGLPGLAAVERGLAAHRGVDVVHRRITVLDHERPAGHGADHPRPIRAFALADRDRLLRHPMLAGGAALDADVDVGQLATGHQDVLARGGGAGAERVAGAID